MDPKRDEISKFSFSAGYPWIEQEPGQHLRIVLQQLRRIISGMPSSRLLANESSGCGKFRILGMHYSKQLLCRIQLHSAKKALHSAKPLPSAALGKELSAYPFSVKLALPSAACRPLGKGFAEGYGGTPQRKAAVTPGRGDGPFAECHPRHLAKKFKFF
jgi:hypothetical protein